MTMNQRDLHKKNLLVQRYLLKEVIGQGAMETAHNGIFFEGEICPVIHRDLKPSNIYVIERETGESMIKLLDFGIAKLIKNDVGRTEHFMGTPRYCSPEQLQGNDLDNRSDIYSLGMVMYFMLTKKYPWDLEIDSVGEWYKAHTQLTPAKFSPDLKIPVEIEKLILRCLEKSPHNRPQSVGEIIQKLEGITRQLNLQNSSHINHKISTSDFDNQEFSNQLSNLDDFLLDSKWPKNKPIYSKNSFPSDYYL